jgi:hypothetical protein
MIAAIEIVINEYARDEINTLTFLTLSSISINNAFKYVARNCNHAVMLFGDEEDGNDFRSLLQQSLLGGYSSILCSRYEEAGKTKIRPHKYHDQARTTQRIITYDTTAMYTGALSMNLPVSIYALRRPEDGFIPKLLGNTRGQDAIQWLEFQAAVMQTQIRHMGNDSEKHIRITTKNNELKLIRVDGYSSNPPVVYEYVQCKFHSGYCPSCRTKYPPYIFFANGKSSQELERELAERFQAIENAGYQLITMWSCEWMYEKENNELAKYVVRNCIIGPEINDNGMTEREIFSAVQDGTLEGFLLCSAVVPVEMREYFADLPPIFKKCQISRDDLSDEMREYCIRHDLLPHSTNQLVTGYHMEDQLCYSSYIQYLMDLGVEFYNLKRVYQFRTAPIFKEYLEKISEARVRAQQEGNNVRSSNCKMLGNSLYGSTLRTQLKDTVCRFAYSEKEVARYMGDPLLSSMTECGGEITEFTLKKSNLLLKSPITLGMYRTVSRKIDVAAILLFIHQTLHSRSEPTPVLYGH